MGAEAFTEWTVGFDERECYDLLREDYSRYESVNEYYGGSIATTNNLKIVKEYDNARKRTIQKAEREREKLFSEIGKWECGVQKFPLGYGVVRLVKNDNKVKDGSRKYSVRVYLKNLIEGGFELYYGYDRKFNSLKEAQKYVENLFYELPIDYATRLFAEIESWKGERRITYRTELKVYRKKPKKLPKRSRGRTVYKLCYFGWGAV